MSLVDTGDATMTGGRLKRVAGHLDGGGDFCFTYGDGVSDLDIASTVKFHKAHGGLASVTAVYPPKRFGQMEIIGDKVTDFKEKPDGEGGYINGGFFVLSPKVLDYVEGDATIWEREPLEHLSRNQQLFAFRHDGFWQPMDTLRDKTYLEELWASGRPPWKSWP